MVKELNLEQRDSLTSFDCWDPRPTSKPQWFPMHSWNQGVEKGEKEIPTWSVPFCFYKNILTAQGLSLWSLMLCWPLCSQGSPGWQCFRNQVSELKDKGQTQGKARESSQPLTESRLGLPHVPGHCSRPALSTSSEMTTETALQDFLGPVCLSSLNVA